MFSRNRRSQAGEDGERCFGEYGKPYSLFFLLVSTMVTINRQGNLDLLYDHGLVGLRSPCDPGHCGWLLRFRKIPTHPSLHVVSSSVLEPNGNSIPYDFNHPVISHSSSSLVNLPTLWLYCIYIVDIGRNRSTKQCWFASTAIHRSVVADQPRRRLGIDGFCQLGFKIKENECENHTLFATQQSGTHSNYYCNTKQEQALY